MTKHERYEHGVGPIYTTPLIDSLPLNPDHSDGILQAMPSRKDLDEIAEKHDRIVAGYEILLHHWRVQQAEIALLREEKECYKRDLEIERVAWKRIQTEVVRLKADVKRLTDDLVHQGGKVCDE